MENSIEKQIIHSRKEAPYLLENPKIIPWYRISIPEGITGDGSAYHIYIKKGTGKNLCVFLSGGGSSLE